MRNLILLTGLVISSLTLPGFGAQTQPTVLERGPNHRLVQNESGGIYTELADGICYQDQAGNWIDSEELFEIVGATAVARRGAYTVTLAANINTERVVELVAQGKRFVSRFAGISYFDSASGQNILVGRIQDSIGVIHPPNQVIYPDALVGEGFTADVRYTWRKGSFEQDVIFRGRPPAPEAFLLNPASTRIQAWTLFLEAPVPQIRTRVIRSEENPVLRLAMADPDFSDDLLNFDGLQVSQGRAFAVGDTQELPRSIPVGKEWGQAENGDTFLIESVEYPAAKQSLNALAIQGARLQPERNANVAALRLSRQQLMAALAKPSLGRKAPEAKLQMAKVRDMRKGFAIDYEILTTYGYVDFVFAADKTYYINGQVNLSGGGTAVFEKGSVIKFPPYNYYYPDEIRITGSGSRLNCASGPMGVTTLTARDDDSIGEVISGSTGTPSGYYGTTALHFDYSSSAVLSSLSNVRIRYAKTGIMYANGTGHTLTHSQLINCETAITLYYAEAHARNVLVANNAPYTSGKVSSGSSSSILRGENVTFHDATLRPSGSYDPTMYLVNSMLVNAIGFYSGTYNQSVSSGAGVFQTVGAGSRYLATDAYRNSGTLAINATLLADLRKRTTYAPLQLTANFTAPTVLSLRGIADVDGIDLGYHYDLVDYAWSGRELSSSLLLTNGVVVAHHGTSGTILQNGAKFISEGSPLYRNTLVHYRAIQENTSAWDPEGSTFGFLSTSGAQSVSAPEIFLRFTDISVPANVLSKRHLLQHANGNFPQSISLRDCDISGAYLLLSNSASGAASLRVGVTNNIWRRGTLTIRRDATTPVDTFLYNNLFLNSTLGLLRNNTAGTIWEVKDNLFDTVGLTFGPETITRTHNGYLNTAGYNQANNDKQVSVRDYQTGALGAHYYPAPNQGNNNLGILLTAGSRTAAAAGLYHHTIKPDQSKAGEPAIPTPPKVSIGYHYIVLSGTQPQDTDQDAIVDYQEDENGTGSREGAETDWNDPDSDNDDLWDGWERLYAFDPLDGTGVNGATGNPDSDELNNLEEFSLGLDPRLNQAAVVGSRRNYQYDLNNRLRVVTGKAQVTITPDKEGNVTNVAP